MRLLASILTGIGIFLVPIGLQLADVQNIFWANVAWIPGVVLLGLGIALWTVVLVRGLRRSSLDPRHRWPHLTWQEPRASVVTDLTTLRRQIEVVLRNVGENALITDIQAETVAGIPYAFVHFVAPSVIPANEVVRVRLLRDEHVEPYFWGEEGDTATPLADEEVIVRLDYDDAVRDEPFRTQIRLVARFSEAQHNLAAAGPLPAEPDQLHGRVVSCEFRDRDARPPRSRHRRRN